LDAHSVERKLAAIFAADVAGYSRLVGQEQVGTLRTLTAYRVITDRLIAAHRGRIFTTAGDNVVAESLQDRTLNEGLRRIGFPDK
jgi:adenylate cyclase